MATSVSAKKASDSIPFCKDQGLPYLVGTNNPGVSIQASRYTMVAGGVFNFAAQGLANMLDGTYIVHVLNNTGSAAAKVAQDTTRNANGFVITGPTAGDGLDVIIVGCIAGQLKQ